MVSFYRHRSRRVAPWRTHHRCRPRTAGCATTVVESDIDGDGTNGSILEELQGISGQDIEIWVRFDNTRDDAELFAVEQDFMRDPTAQEPPWEGTRYDD